MDLINAVENHQRSQQVAVDTAARLDQWGQSEAAGIAERGQLIEDQLTIEGREIMA